MVPRGCDNIFNLFFQNLKKVDPKNVDLPKIEKNFFAQKVEKHVFLEFLGDFEFFFFLVKIFQKFQICF